MLTKLGAVENRLKLKRVIPLLGRYHSLEPILGSAVDIYSEIPFSLLESSEPVDPFSEEFEE